MLVKLERWFFNMPEVNDRRIIVQAKQNDDDDTRFQNMEIDDSDEDEPALDIVGYYILDLQTGGVSTLPRTIQNGGKTSCVVAVGSRIYLLGRPIRNSDSSEPSSCYFSDLTHNNTSPPMQLWKRAHPIITNPLHGDGVAFDGKIFYFRTPYNDSFFSYSAKEKQDNISSFCEVFDPTQPDPHWQSIESKPPGQGLILVPPVLADYDNKRIIVFLSTRLGGSLYAYYPSEDRWECVVETFLQTQWFSYRSIVTIADGVIYVYYRDLEGFFKAYDIHSNEWLEVKVPPAVKQRSESYYLPLFHYVSVIHLGKGVLCLLGWIDEGKDDTTHIHLVQFQVKVLNVDDKKEVLVTPLSIRVFYVNSNCSAYQCLAL